MRAGQTDVQDVATLTLANHDGTACRCLECAGYQDWLNGRPDLWTAGGSAQRELFAKTFVRVGETEQCLRL